MSEPFQLTSAPSAMAAPLVLDRAEYLGACEKRWFGAALQDARRNWVHWQEQREFLEVAMRTFKRDPQQEDVSGKHHNPDGTLTSFLWKLQENVQADRSCLFPLLDFEEHFQKVFLRRGLIIFCTMILRQIEAKQEAA